MTSMNSSGVLSSLKRTSALKISEEKELKKSNKTTDIVTSPLRNKLKSQKYAASSDTGRVKDTVFVKDELNKLL